MVRHLQLRWIVRIGPHVLVALYVVLRVLRQVFELVAGVPDVQVIVARVKLVLSRMKVMVSANRTAAGHVNMSLRGLCRLSVRDGISSLNFSAMLLGR